MEAKRFKCKRDTFLFPYIDQGLVHGLPVTWNPDDEKFHVHATGIEDGTQVLGRFTSWNNTVAFAQRKGRPA